ncbi:type 1 glutamine amidotransferase [Desulfomonile tiedjei]|uniref:GMP synthase family protein n=1 Tax=Desulfomonile tiedjei (strain ATCC 49306 / DSM 6799 / DCB-1) TaxID=706587 RepID=I4C7A3_DESTA|nr:gamma-glutamyl-gamma-aminobutyrate hydrolase family protein [Desulfomonile tiedjei]AFM25444.1 GMP synthase family protein [Desulfomonile tiedjei DSM 6799]
MNLNRCFFFFALAAILSIAITPCESAKTKRSEKLKPKLISTTPEPTTGTWIVVNLFSGRTSRQAEKVRDILAGLGAEGTGIVLPYREITVKDMKARRPSFLALSPNGVPWCKYDPTELDNFLKALKTIVEELEIPVIGICGGHQALALAFGGKVGPINGSEDDCIPYKKNPTEKGRHNIFVVADDPLFQGMGKTLNLVQNHYDEVKKLPPGFVRLAENDLCRHQIIKHPTKPAYGVQAHTEYYLKNRPDGGLLLKNFLKIATTHNKISRPELVTPQDQQSKERDHDRRLAR